MLQALQCSCEAVLALPYFTCVATVKRNLLTRAADATRTKFKETFCSNHSKSKTEGLGSHTHSVLQSLTLKLHNYIPV